MDIPKITDGELNIMNILWENGPLTATDIVRMLNRDIGWNRNTTYTFINRLVKKQVIRRDEPAFVCTPLYSRDVIASSETRSLLNKMFGGSLKTMVASFLESDASTKEITEVKQMIANWEEIKREEIKREKVKQEEVKQEERNECRRRNERRRGKEHSDKKYSDKECSDKECSDKEYSDKECSDKECSDNECTMKVSRDE